MAELLIKIGDSFPHKDFMLAHKASDKGAKDDFIEREASQVKVFPIAKGVYAKRNQRIKMATERWELKRKALYHHGDIVKVRPDGWNWGKRESFPRFKIARVPDSVLSLAGFKYSGPRNQLRIERLFEPHYELHPREVGPQGKFKYFNRSKFYLPSSLVDSLSADNISEVPTIQFLEKTAGHKPYDPGRASPHGSAGTYTIKSSGGDYSDLSDFVAGEASDLVTEGAGACIAECYNDWSNGLVDSADINGFTTDSSNYVRVYTPISERHNGTMGSVGSFTGFTMYRTDDTNIYLVNDHYTRTIGLSIWSNNTSSGNGHPIDIGDSSADDCRTEKCIFRGAYNSGYMYSVLRIGGDDSMWSNLLIYDGPRSTRLISVSEAGSYQFYVYYCTTTFSPGDGLGLGIKERYKVRNCLSTDNVGDDFSYASGTTADMEYCASEDGTADDFGSSNHEVNVTVSYENKASDDFHLDSGDSDVIGKGTPLHGDADYPVSDDIDNGNRDITAPDIGFDEQGEVGTTLAPTTAAPTTLAPTTSAPTTLAPTTLAPTTAVPTTVAPTTAVPTTSAPTTLAPTTSAPTTAAPTTASPTTSAPTTSAPTTIAPSTAAPTTIAPSTVAPTTLAPTTSAPTTLASTAVPTTAAPTTSPPEQEQTCFSDYPVGVPGDWTEQWTPADGILTVTNGGAIGGQVGGLVHAVGNSHYAISWDDCDPTANDQEILVRFRQVTFGNFTARFVLRGGGSAGLNTKSGLMVTFHDSGNELRLTEWDGVGGWANLATVAYGYAYNTWTWLRFRANGTRVQVKAWTGSFSAEPGAWNIDVNTATDQNGWIGASVWDSSGVNELDWFAYASRGLTANDPGDVLTCTSQAPTTAPVTTVAPTTVAPTTVAPTTVVGTTILPTTVAPSTAVPTTAVPTTLAPTTVPPTSIVPTTSPFPGMPLDSEMTCEDTIYSLMTTELSKNSAMATQLNLVSLF